MHIDCSGFSPCSLGEAVAEHRQSAHGFGLRRFVLEDVPVLGELAVFENG